jgi:hypothetical protein
MAEWVWKVSSRVIMRVTSMDVSPLLRHLFVAATAVVLGAGTFVLAETPRLLPQAVASSVSCVVTGRVSNGASPLPGVSLKAVRDGNVVSATSTDVAGAYRLRLPPGEYQITADLPAFATIDQQVSLPPATPANGSDSGCGRVLDLQLMLRSRAQPITTAPRSATDAAPTTPATPAARGFGRGAAAAGQNGAVPGRFAQLQVVQAETAGAADAESTAVDDADPAVRLLPPGFSTSADTNVVAVTGDAANVDRGQLRDRVEALGRGEFDAAGAQRPEGFDAPGGRIGGGAFAQAGPPGAEAVVAPGSVGRAAAVRRARVDFSAADAVRIQFRDRRRTPLAVPVSMLRRIRFASTPNRTPTTCASSSAPRSVGHCVSRASTTDRDRRSSSTIPARDRATSSISTRPSLPRRCGPVISATAQL